MTSPVERLVEVMDQLRSPGGCPWDAQQTHQSLARYLVEETYETLEAMDSGDLVSLREELGDLLLQIVFHARIAQETDEHFSLDSIAQGVVDKLVRRHPHVFGDETFETEEQLEANWVNIKAQEKPRESVTEGVPAAMPSLQVATQLMYRARKLEIPASDGSMREKIRAAIPEISDDTIKDLLIAVVELAREKDIDSESVLRAAMAQYRAQIRTAEGLDS